MVTFDSIRIGILTCYELRFPELSRARALAGTQLLIVNSAFPLIRAQHWDILVEARSIENQMFVAAANRVGSAHDGRLHFAGNSKIVDAMGSIMCSALHTDETLVSANIYIDQIAVVRENIKIFNDRRESIFNSTVVIYPFS